MTIACERLSIVILGGNPNRKLYGYAMPVISIANPKGGAGKTTLAFILADQLSSNGASVAVVDADPNAIIAKWHDRREGEGRATPFAVIAKPSEGAMIATVDQLADQYQFVIVDLEGTASRMTSRAFARSHLILVPFNQSPIDAELAANAVQLIHEESEALQRPLPFRLVRSRDSSAVTTKSSKRIASAIAEAQLPVLDVGLVERAAYRDIFDFSNTLGELDPGTTSGLENARGNAAALAASVIEAIREEYPQ